MINPILSICIPTFNRARLLSDLLECLTVELRDTGKLVEVVVCDNCSEDHTNNLVHSFENNLNLKYFKNDRNIGAAANIFFIPNHATGDFCWIIGDDDLLVPGSIALILKHIQNNPDESGIVVGYSYEKANNRRSIKQAKTPISFSGSVFPDINIQRKINKWEDTFLLTNYGALHTATVSCIFNRRLWLECSHDHSSWQLEPALTSLESTFPHTVVWARMFVGKPVYFISRPLVYFFVGEQEWFKPKWGTILFSFTLELAQLFRSLRASPVAVEYYEDIILKLDATLLPLILSPSDYSKEHFSLDWLVKCYGDRPVFLECLDRLICSAQGCQKTQVGFRLVRSMLRPPSKYARLLRLSIKVSKQISKTIIRMLIAKLNKFLGRSKRIAR